MKSSYLLWLLLPSSSTSYVQTFSLKSPSYIRRTTVYSTLVDEEVGAPKQDPSVQTTSASGASSGSQFANQPDFTSPAEYENTKFNCDESVQFWRDLNRNGQMEASDMIKEVTTVSNRFLTQGNTDAISYWTRHALRSGYFTGNAVLGTVASQLHERIRGLDQPEDGTSFTDLLTQPKVVSRVLMDTAFSYEQDYQCIQQGIYKLPYDMYTRNRQNSPVYIGQQTARFVNEAIGTLTRRNRGSQQDKDIWISDASTSSFYPKYYQTAFHYQTDGWMSYDSANVYETSTETLFLGRQDAMQRTALVPLMKYSEEFQIKQRKEGGDVTRPLKVLEVACGTGRFLTFARDNLPLNTEFTAVDLSPFYLQAARENDKNWISMQKKQIIESTTTATGNTTQILPAKMVQAKAEDLPFADEEFDVVVCMYLYHELPRNIREMASAEIGRVLKHGGIGIFTDSCQLGDRPVMDDKMGNFEKMNEPYYKDYIQDYLPSHFERAGLQPLTKSMRSSTKTLTFAKPIL